MFFVRNRPIIFVTAMALLLVTVACGPSQEEQEAAARQAALEELQTMKDELEAKRQELADLLAQPPAEEEEGEGEAMAEESMEGEEEAGAAEELDLAEALQAEVDQMTDDFNGQLVEFINADPPIAGEEMSDAQKAAIAMKSHEDVLVARTYIDEGGDYKRAIRIFQDALAIDPDNQEVAAALAEAEELRFMTTERFAEVQKGMTRDEVRDTLGQVNLRNIREFPDRGVVGWFYPTAEDGSAAGVYFRKKGEEYVVYETNFEAVKAKTSEEAEE